MKKIRVLHPILAALPLIAFICWAASRESPPTPGFEQERDSVARQSSAMNRANQTPWNMEFTYRIVDRQGRAE